MDESMVFFEEYLLFDIILKVKVKDVLLLVKMKEDELVNVDKISKIFVKF